MAEKLSIRKGRIADRKQALELWKELMDYQRSLIDRPMFDFVDDVDDVFMDIWDLHVRSRNKLALIAELSDRPIGILIAGTHRSHVMDRREGYAHVLELAVTKKFRRKGIGQMLMEEFTRWAKDKGEDCLVLEVLPENDIAKDFYAKLGYESIVEVWRKLI